MDEATPDQPLHRRLRFLAWADVVELTSLSRESIRLMVRAGQFPAPRPITAGRSVFVEAEVEQWMRDKLAQPVKTIQTNVARAPAAAKPIRQ
jgi:predicted DNA-binding transcriptional regulator AlpA